MFSLIYRDEHVQELENQLTSTKEHIDQLGNERTDLIAKVCYVKFLYRPHFVKFNYPFAS